MNDLPTCNPRTRSTKVKGDQVNSHQRFLASRNQIKLIILEPRTSDLVTNNKFWPLTVYAKAGHPKKVVCHHFDRHSDFKHCHCLTLSLKIKVIAKIKWSTKIESDQVNFWHCSSSLKILELSKLGHRIGSFSPTQYEKVGQLTFDNTKLMCHLSMKFFV